MKNKIIFCSIFLIFICSFSASAIRLKIQSGDIYESRNPYEYGGFFVGKRLSHYSTEDIFVFNYNARTMTWKDYKGKSTYKMEQLEHDGNITIFTTLYHIVKVTKNTGTYFVELVYKDGTDYYLLRLNCIEL